MLDATPSSAEMPFNPSFAPARASMNVWFISYTLLVYDYFYTLETEINDVWTCQWSLGLILFYLNRYLPLIEIFLFLHPVLMPGPISEQECKWIYPVNAWLATLSLIISQTVIVLRTYAIWGRRRLILWILTPIAIILFSSLLAVTSWNTYNSYHKLQSFSVPGHKHVPDGVRCQLSALSIDKKGGLIFLIFYLTVFLGEAAIVVLTAIKANQHVSKSSPRWISQLYKNGIIYCVCMLALSLVNSIVTFSAPAAFKLILLPAQRSLHSVLSNRVMLLIFQHRNRNLSGNTQDRRRPKTYAESTMAIFTSIYPETADSVMDETSWQTRAQLEWVQ